VSFSVLVVCTGNICRSPLGERLLVARQGDLSMTVTSAGTSALVGRGMDEPSALVLRELGGDPSGHSARRLTRDMANACDLILTAETSHRSKLLQAEPSLFRRTFTLREFARLGADLDPLTEEPTEEALRKRVLAVADRRGWVEPAAAGQDEIGDPFGAGLDVARRVGTQIASAVDAVLLIMGAAA
jgi:protein-tyrosine phosphatase